MDHLLGPDIFYLLFYLLLFSDIFHASLIIFISPILGFEFEVHWALISHVVFAATIPAPSSAGVTTTSAPRSITRWLTLFAFWLIHPPDFLDLIEILINVQNDTQLID